MGLTITVGAFIEASEEPEWGDFLREEFEQVNRFLRLAGLPEHREPEDLPSEDFVSYDMLGYWGLQYLRRFAAHLAVGKYPEPLRECTKRGTGLWYAGV